MLTRSRFIFASALWLRALFGVALLPIPAHAQNATLLGSWPTRGPPLGLAIDLDGNVLLSTPTAAPPIFRYSVDGTLLSQIGFSGYLDVYGIAVTHDGDIFYADYSRGRVWRLSSTGGDLGGWGLSGCCLRYIAADNAGYVYITGGNLVRRYTITGNFGVFLSGEWSSNHPSGIAYLGGVLYVASVDGGTISKYSITGTFLGSFPTGATAAEELSVGPDGRIYLVDAGTSRIVIFAPNGAIVGTIGGLPAGYAYGPARYIGVAVASDGTIFAGDFDHARVLRFTLNPTPTNVVTWGRLKVLHR